MRRVVVAVILSLAGCDEPGRVGGDIADISTQQDVSPPAGTARLTIAYTLASGTERYLCKSFSSGDGDVAITAVTPRHGKLVHHTLLVTSTADEPDGVFECDTLLKEGWSPIWASGTGDDGLSLPRGVGFRIPAHSRYVVQYHLLNAGVSEVSDESHLDLALDDAPSALEPASFLAVGRNGFTIPGDERAQALEFGCTLDRDFDVFAIFPHMHQLGKKLELFVGDGPAVYTIDPWPFGDQPLEPFDLQLRAGDDVRVRCTWDNTTGHDVGWGESSFEEMCVVLLFASGLERVDGCGF